MKTSAPPRTLKAVLFLSLFLAGSHAYATWEANQISHWPGEFDSFDNLGTNHITPMGNINFSAAKVDNGFLLDGNGYLELQDIHGFDGQNFTFHMWLQPNLDYVHEQIIFKIYHRRGDTSVSLLPSGRLCARAQWRHGGCTFETAANIFLRDSMIHLTIAYADNTLRLFKNGVLISSGTGNCCYPFEGSIYIGGEARANTRMRGIIDEVYYLNRALSNTEVLDMYNDFVFQNPNPELLAALDEAYEEIALLENQVSYLSDTNILLENQIFDLESQNNVTLSQVFELETQIDNLDDQVVQLEIQVESLESRVGQLELDITDLQAQIAELKQLVTSLESEVLALEIKVNELQAEINRLKLLVVSSLDAIESDFRATFKDPEFELIGETPEEEMEHLVKAITNLKKNYKKALYKQLREGGYHHKKRKYHHHFKYFLDYKKYSKYKYKYSKYSHNH